MLHYRYFKHILEFAFDARTSRGEIKKHAAYIIEVYDTINPSVIGRGEASPLSGLSIDSHDDFENQLVLTLQQLNDGIRQQDIDLSILPSIRFALETAKADLLFGGKMKKTKYGAHWVWLYQVQQREEMYQNQDDLW